MTSRLNKRTLQEQYDQLVALANKFIQFRHCMSYNECYFGEHEGLVKETTEQMDRLITNWTPTGGIQNYEAVGYFGVDGNGDVQFKPSLDVDEWELHGKAAYVRI